MINNMDQAATLRSRAASALSSQSTLHRSARVLAISSGKGGAGKTIVAVNLALRFARSGLRTLLVDLDPGLANVDVHMRLHAKWDADDLLADKCSALDAILVADCGLRVLPGGRASEAQRPARDGERDAQGPRRLLGILGDEVQDLDVIVLDTGAGIGPWVRGALEVADCNLVVTQSDPASVTDAYTVLKVASQLRVANNTGLVVNRVREKREAMLTASRLRKVTQQFLDEHPKFFGWIHERNEISDSVHHQLPFVLQLGEHHAATLEVAALAAKIADHMKLPTPRQAPVLPRRPSKLEH